MSKLHGEIKDILESYRCRLTAPGPGWPEEVVRTISFIHEHLFDSSLTIRWLKEQCRINGDHVSAKFRYYMGRGVKEYIQHHRLNAAKEILSNQTLNEVTILELALALGYSGKGAFNHTFKKLTDKTPQQWRNDALSL